MKIRILLVASVLLFSSAAFAENYGSIGLGFVDIEGYDAKSLELKGGASSGHLGAEVRMGIGIDEEAIELENYLGGYLKLSSSESGPRVYGVLGFARVDVGETDEDMSYGFGIESDRGLFAEYLVLYDEDNVDITSVTIGFVSRY